MRVDNTIKVPSPGATNTPATHNVSGSSHNQLVQAAATLNIVPKPLTEHLRLTNTPTAQPDLTTVSSTQHIADTLMKEIKSHSPSREALQRFEFLHKHILAADPSAKLDKSMLINTYNFLKLAQHFFDKTDIHHRRRSQEHFVLARALKWQYRSAISLDLKNHLDKKLQDMQRYIEDGGALSKSSKVGLQVALTPLQTASAGLYFSSDTTLASTPAKYITKTSTGGIGINLKGSLSEILKMEGYLELNTFKSQKYDTLNDYVKANSTLISSWFDQSKSATLLNLPDLLSLTTNFEKDLFMANMSQPFIRSALATPDTPAITLNRFLALPEPLETETGTSLKTGGSLSLNAFGMIKASSSVDVEEKISKKKKKLDAIDMVNSHPATVKGIFAPPSRTLDASTLSNALKQHIEDSSTSFTSKICANASPPEIRAELSKIQKTTLDLQKQYVTLKLNDLIDEATEKEILNLFNEHPLILRPRALKTYTLSADKQITTVSPQKLVEFDNIVKAGTGITAKLMKIKDDDPHLSGDYLELTTHGQLKTMETLEAALQTALGGLTTPLAILALSSVTSTIGGIMFRQSHGFSNTSLIKLKEQGPILLLNQQFVNLDNHFGASLPASGVGQMNIEDTLSESKLLSEQLGTESLEFIFPIARKRLSLDDSAWWDNYVNDHEKDFGSLIKNIAGASESSALVQELNMLRGLNERLKDSTDRMITQARHYEKDPNPDNFKRANEALKILLNDYVETHYKKEVAKAWSFS